MTVSEALEKIGKALAILMYQTREENLSGMFSKNRLTEDLLLPVFRIALKAPNLRNLNLSNANFPAIDLADDQAQLAIQVTTERDSSKITDTIEDFIKRGFQKAYHRLIVFLLADAKPSYSQKTKNKWKKLCKGKLTFDPSSDIISIAELFPLIEGLDQKEIYEVHDTVAQSVIGESYVDVEKYLTRLSLQQLEYEKQSTKYIPDVFVETRQTKNLARSFSHPVLFFRRTIESLGRLNVASWNLLLAKAGLPALPNLSLASFQSDQTLADVGATAASLSAHLAELKGVLSKYATLSFKGLPPFPVKADRQYYYDENTYTLQTTLGMGLGRELADLLNELAVVQARVFILTGRAGQGKTNMVCDFVETFLTKHKVPCAYLTGRALRLMQAPDLGDTIQRILFEGKTSSFAEAANLLSKHASRTGKPFVLIIDGLNEHHRISEFADQLEAFIETTLGYPHIKLFLTCRSEFFQQRFGRLTTGPLKSQVFLLESNEHRFDEECYGDMIDGYFRFFKVDNSLVSRNAVESLKKDFLLLRFFCEVYGTRGKAEGYKAAYVANIYRHEIFKVYLERRLDTADVFLRHVSGRERLTTGKHDLIDVLEECVRHMISKGQFVNVPISVIPANLRDALFALLDEELILRRDAPEGLSIFPSSEETINFTFDEFRDFLLAQYLLHLYESDRAVLEQCIARCDPKDSQIIEGLKKFLFYASRDSKNGEFWDYYKDQPWYWDVYDREIFNIDPQSLRMEDRNVVAEGLRKHDDKMWTYAPNLAIRWEKSAYPVLNLDLLISVMAEGDDSNFDRVGQIFRSSSYSDKGVSAKAFCSFITDKILPDFAPGPDAPEDSLFRFLILLLPVDSIMDLNSQSYLVYRKLLSLHPGYAVNLLKESLQYKPTRHRPFVWRLLASVVAEVSSDETVHAKAEADKVRGAEADPVLYREVNRFLELSTTATGVMP